MTLEQMGKIVICYLQLYRLGSKFIKCKGFAESLTAGQWQGWILKQSIMDPFPQAIFSPFISSLNWPISFLPIQLYSLSCFCWSDTDIPLKSGHSLHYLHNSGQHCVRH